MDSPGRPPGPAQTPGCPSTGIPPPPLALGSWQGRIAGSSRRTSPGPRRGRNPGTRSPCPTCGRALSGRGRKSRPGTSRSRGSGRSRFWPQWGMNKSSNPSLSMSPAQAPCAQPVCGIPACSVTSSKRRPPEIPVEIVPGRFPALVLELVRADQQYVQQAVPVIVNDRDSSAGRFDDIALLRGRA